MDAVGTEATLRTTDPGAPPARRWRPWAWAGTVAGLAWAFVPDYGPLFATYRVPSSAMAPAYAEGDLLLVSRFAYGYSRWTFDSLDLWIKTRVPEIYPRRGDVVLLRLPRDPMKLAVRRVAGLPGDRVQMQGGRLVLNGVTVERTPSGGLAGLYTEALPTGVSYMIKETGGDLSIFDTTQETTVLPGHVFVLGDNRDAAIDSRAPAARFGGMGTIRLMLVVGPVVARLEGGGSEAAK